MKQVSRKQIRANRRNALRSTGPRTPEGKRAVRWNALKHGLLAREVVLPVGEGNEDAEEFQNLLAELRDDLEPAGVLEEILVEKIAVCYWRLRRVLRAEMGEIRQRVAGVAGSMLLPMARQVQIAENWSAEGKPTDLAVNSLGVEVLLRLLEKFEQEVERTGSLSNASREAIAKYFSLGSRRLASQCATLWPLPTDGTSIHPAPEAPPPPPTGRQELLSILGEEKERLEAELAAARHKEDRRLDSQEARLGVPEALDKLLRYESALERQLYRALHHWERMQRRRKGELLPPPLSVDFSCER
jgi:hypothetical protein